MFITQLWQHLQACVWKEYGEHLHLQQHLEQLQALAVKEGSRHDTTVTLLGSKEQRGAEPGPSEWQLCWQAVLGSVRGNDTCLAVLLLLLHCCALCAEGDTHRPFFPPILNFFSSFSHFFLSNVFVFLSWLEYSNRGLWIWKNYHWKPMKFLFILLPWSNR